MPPAKQLKLALFDGGYSNTYHLAVVRAPRDREMMLKGIVPSFDPLIAGEHEVDPVRCQCCGAQIPWRIIKGWRD